MAKASSTIRSEATRPLYASVGVADRAVEFVRGSVTDLQERLTSVQRSVRDPKEARASVEARVKALQERTRTRLEDNEFGYDQLVARGQVLVERIRRQESTKGAVRSARTASAKAKTTTTQAEKAARSTARSAEQSARTTSSAAKRQASKPKSSAKATATAAKDTAAKGAKATADAAKKVGD
jgi:heparin binding hemagglutinin HbhA